MLQHASLSCEVSEHCWNMVVGWTLPDLSGYFFTLSLSYCHSFPCYISFFTEKREKEAQSIPRPFPVWSFTIEQPWLPIMAWKGEFLLTAEVTIIELFISPSCLCHWGGANSRTSWQSEQRACQCSLQTVAWLLPKLLLLASPPPHLPYLAEFSKATAKLETIAFVHVAVPVTCLQWRH